MNGGGSLCFGAGVNRALVNSLLPAGKRILVAGELILDEFIWGKVSRISPEAPVPVVEVVRESCNAGGAANVARNLREFARDVYMLGLAGTDAAAGRLRGLLEAAGIHLDCVQVDPVYPTISKTRIVGGHQQVVRVDRERRVAFTEAQKERALAQYTALLPSLDAVIMEDYAKGLLDQSLADEMVQRARAAGKIVTVDPNPTNRIIWRGVTSITPNRAEAFAAAGLPLSDPAENPMEDKALLETGARLLERWECEHLLITLSEHGMILFDPGQPPIHFPTRAQEVFDVSGAGDTAIALYTHALAGGATPAQAAVISNHASGIVVGKLGTATVTREELLETFPE